MRLLSCTLTMSQIHYIPFLAMINLFCVWIQSFLSFFDDLGYSQRLSQWRGVCFVISTSCYAFSLLWPHWTIWSHLIFVCRCSNSLVAISYSLLGFHIILPLNSNEKGKIQTDLDGDMVHINNVVSIMNLSWDTTIISLFKIVLYKSVYLNISNGF